MTARRTSELTDLVRQLKRIRKQHEQALAQIEYTFQHLGLSHLLEEGGSRRGRGGRGGRPGAAAAPSKRSAGKAAGKRAGKGAGKRRVRGSYAQSGDEMILQLVRDSGSATTQEVRARWETEGRGGKADNNLTQLVKTGRLVRTKETTEGRKGSVYTLPKAG